VTSPISDTFLHHIQSNLDIVREAGLKCILRFAYTDDLNNEEPPFGDATKTQILAHIDQLEPLLRANSDVIAVMQAGFIGVWGEWYYTDHFVDDPTKPWVISSEQWQNRRDVLTRISQALPSSRSTAVRTVEARQQIFNTTLPLTTTTAHNETAYARTGYHNDCFLASDTDYGTWFTAQQKEYMAADSQFLPVGGESCNLNPPRSECATALSELALFHWSYLNIEYHPEVLQSWVDGGCIDEIRRRLGYRLQLRQGQYSNEARPAHQFTVNLELENVGYAAPFNPRPVQILLRHNSTDRVYAATLPEDVRTWYANESQQFEYEICTPDNLPDGDYELLLNMPDPADTLQTRAEYAILFANEDVQEPHTGYNKLLHTLTIHEAAKASPCTASSIQMESLTYLTYLSFVTMENNVSFAARKSAEG
jgi:hypothetical protein